MSNVRYCVYLYFIIKLCFMMDFFVKKKMKSKTKVENLNGHFYDE